MTCYTPAEMMTVAAARALDNRDVCFVGIGLPSAACNLARLTHAPRIHLIYESGTLGTRPDVLPLSIGDGELCETALTTVSVPEIFRYWLQGGRITVGFLGGAQVDRFGNLNSTVIGNYAKPKVRLPGSGGATEIATGAGQIFIVMRHGPRSFVKQLDFLTTLGHGRTGRERRELGHPHEGPDAAGDRPVHHAAGRGDQRDGGGQPAPGDHARAGLPEHELGSAVRGYGGGDRAAVRGGAGSAA